MCALGLAALASAPSPAVCTRGERFSLLGLKVALCCLLKCSPRPHCCPQRQKALAASAAP